MEYQRWTERKWENRWANTAREFYFQLWWKAHSETQRNINHSSSHLLSVKIYLWGIATVNVLERRAHYYPAQIFILFDPHGLMVLHICITHSFIYSFKMYWALIRHMYCLRHWAITQNVLFITAYQPGRDEGKGLQGSTVCASMGDWGMLWEN